MESTCVYRSKSRGGPLEEGGIKRAGGMFILFRTGGVALERMHMKREGIFEGSLYLAAVKEEYLLQEEKTKELISPCIEQKQANYRPRRVRVPPAPEGSLVFTPRAYIEPVYLRYFKDYQVEGVRFMFEKLRSSGGAILADEMGLGKTFQAIAVARLFCRAGGTVLILSPCSLAGVWEREVKKWAGVLRVYNGVEKSPEKYKGIEDIVLLSYERISTWKSLSKHEISLIICDEAHRLRTGTSQSLNALKKIETKKLLLTGTPFQNSIKEYRTLLSLVDTRAEGAKGTKELTAIAEETILRRKIERTSLSLPEKNELIWLVYNKEYAETEEIYRRETASLGIQALQKLRGTISMSPSKWRLFYSLSKEILQQRHSLVVISRYIEGVKRAREVLNTLCGKEEVPLKKKDLVVFHGEMSVGEREESLSSFQREGQKVIILSAKCGGEGLTLTKATRMIILDSDWNPANDLQVMARIWRLGQTHPVVIHRLFLMGTVEEHVLLVQMKKREIQRELETEDTSSNLSPNEVKGVFTLQEDSVVHRWMGCTCTQKSTTANPEGTSTTNSSIHSSNEYHHIHTESGLILRKVTNPGVGKITERSR